MDIRYIAGFFDGEGWVGIEKYGGRTRIVVSIGQVDNRPLKKIQEQFGGLLRLRLKSNDSYIYEWRVRDRRAINFLVAIRPYLIVKRQGVNRAFRYLNALP